MVYNATGLTSDAVIIPLPTANWTARSDGYQYRDVSTAAISRIVLKPDLITVKGGRHLFGYTLDEPHQGRIAVRLVVASQIWCAEATPKLSGFDTAPNDRVDRFIGRSDVLAAACTPSP